MQNVAPGPRRPGCYPPGVNGTTGSYGLPAAAHYGNAPTRHGHGGPTTIPDNGLGNTTSESSSSPSVTSQEVVTPTVTPFVPHKPLHQEPTIVHTPSAETDDSFRRTLGNTQALAAAQGEQQNEMSRYLHGISDQVEDARKQQNAELAAILADLAKLRGELKPKHVTGHVLPDGRVILSNGDIVDGIRGAQPAAPMAVPLPPAPPPPPPTATHVKGSVMPDGTVMVGGKVVDGIRAPPPAVPLVPVDPQIIRDSDQDRKLAELEAKSQFIEPLFNTFQLINQFTTS